MDFSYNDAPAPRLENEPYWKQYGWMNKLGLNGPRAIVFALIFERDCSDDPHASASHRNTSLAPSMRAAPSAVAARAASRGSSRCSTSYPQRALSAPLWTRTDCP